MPKRIAKAFLGNPKARKFNGGRHAPGEVADIHRNFTPGANPLAINVGE